MKNHVVSDGHFRVLMDKTFQAREAELWQSIRAKYAADHSRAGRFGKIVIHWRMHRDFCHEWKKLAPSRHALYLSNLRAGFWLSGYTRSSKSDMIRI